MSKIPRTTSAGRSAWHTRSRGRRRKRSRPRIRRPPGRAMRKPSDTPSAPCRRARSPGAASRARSAAVLSSPARKVFFFARISPYLSVPGQQLFRVRRQPLKSGGVIAFVVSAAFLRGGVYNEMRVVEHLALNVRGIVYRNRAQMEAFLNQSINFVFVAGQKEPPRGIRVKEIRIAREHRGSVPLGIDGK